MDKLDKFGEKVKTFVGGPHAGDWMQNMKPEGANLDVKQMLNKTSPDYEGFKEQDLK